MDFKKWAFAMSPLQFSGVYERMAELEELQGETDLNQRCIEEILGHLEGERRSLRSAPGAAF